MAAVLCLLAAGCGTQLLYNRLDTVAYFYLATQVSLQPTQSASLKSALRDYLDWHRSTELPRYAAFIETLAAEAAAPLGAARINAARLEIESLWRGSVARGAPAAASWLAGLDPEQVDELFASLGEDDADLRDEYCNASEADRDRDRLKSFVAAAEDWVGRLSPAQRVLIAGRLVALVPSSCGWVESRQLVRATLRETVERRRREPGFTAEVIALLTRPEDRWQNAYRAAFDRNRVAIVGLLAELDASLTAKQRARMVSRLAGFADDFRKLSASRAQVAQAATR